MDLVRGVDLPQNYSVLPNLDHDIRRDLSGARTNQVVPDYEHCGMRSHVLLAACQAGQLSTERGGRGRFTSALLDVLSHYGTENVTYDGLLHLLPDLDK